MEYLEIERHEMKPDIYGGKNMDEHIPMWNRYVYGDMGDDTGPDPLIFDPKDYPPGTIIQVSSPVCPKCGEVYENCMVRWQDGACNFDWTQWAEEQYS
jgi:hypothetical protein